MEQGKIHTFIEEGIGWIKFYHPKSNSLPSVLLNEIARAIHLYDKDASVKVIVIASEGDKAFCAGASFDELLDIKNEIEGKNFFSGFAKVILAMKESSKFVVVRIHGKAIGGGVGIAAAADYSFALDTASVKLSELSIGIGPFVIGPVVERKIGLAAFSELSINAAEWKSAQWAHQKGLYSSLFDSEELMDGALKKLLQTLSSSSIDAMCKMKQMFWEGTAYWNTLLYDRAAVSGALVLSPKTKEILSQFKKA
ncbi:MAG: enoyl-CoA hydratase/isomerase family protein [Flavobacteriales bacterium]